MKKLLIVAVVLAVAITFVHDLGVYVSARRALVESTRDAAELAAGMSNASRDEAARAAADKAAERGVTVYMYDQDGTRVELWTRIEVEGTWVYAPVSAFIEGRASEDPPVLEHYETSPVR